MRQLTLLPILPRRTARVSAAKPVRATTAARRPKHRRRMASKGAARWLPRVLRPTLLSAFALIAMVGGGLLWAGGGLNALGSAGLAWTAAAGIEVRQILVEGRVATSADRILAALDVHKGSPLLAFSPALARERLLALGWVKDARVERRFPDVVYVHLEERRPAAIWQQAGRLALVDETGVVIGEDAVPRFPSLHVIVGPDAPEEFAALSAIMQTRPEMLANVRAAVRVGGRRWNLRLANGMTVLLPERDVATAWQVLADAVRDSALLERDVVHIDLRLPDRLVLRLSPDAAQARDGARGA